MGALEIGMEELLPQKRYHKNKLVPASEKAYCSGKAKRIMGRIDIWN